ncbi:hypothetical protein D9757_014143 [Collybiopsis confluens]|uniref:F-box domain-containing protein n=1 Tax=Collybiopsis confluens TaxID=2823264 RepID=A0A8H5CPL7_9AGAR|nr:hypothetical protein D9757_014143 [Collybiopsis confluens]
MSCLILALPVEIQLMILLRVYESVDQEDSDQVRRGLSQVCRFWGELVLHTSVFWSDVGITVNSVDFSATLRLNHLEPFERQLDEASKAFPYVSRVLQRSGVQPLKIDISLEYDLPEEQNISMLPWTIEHFLLLGKLLVQHAHRIKILSIHSESFYPIHVIFGLLAGYSMPQLEILEVTRDHDIFVEFEHSDIKVLPAVSFLQIPFGGDSWVERFAHPLPNLRRLALSGVPQMWDQLFPYRNLVSLELSYLCVDSRPSYVALRNMLMACRDTLWTLGLWVVTPDIVRGEKIILPHLHHLSLGFVCSSQSAAFVRHLDVPKLLALELGQYNHLVASHANRNGEVNFLTAVIQSLPLHQLSILSLRGMTFSSSSFRLLECLDQCFLANSECGNVPVILRLFFACSRVRNLKLVDCDNQTLFCLATPMYVADANPPGMLPFAVLDRLEIVTGDFEPLQTFLVRDKFWRSGAAPVSRIVDALVLGVPPEWGGWLTPMLKKSTANGVWNGNMDYWVLEGVGKVENLKDCVIEQ